jgi:hypothetical protein
MVKDHLRIADAKGMNNSREALRSGEPGAGVASRLTCGKIGAY